MGSSRVFRCAGAKHPGRMTVALVQAMVLLMARPRTAGELADAVNLNIETVRRWLNTLHEAQLACPCGTRKTGTRGAAAYVWRWRTQ